MDDLRKLQMPVLKRVVVDMETGRELEGEELAAYEAKEAAESARHIEAMHQFEQNMGAIPERINPVWLAEQVSIAKTTGKDDPMTFLRDLVLLRIADDQISDARVCATLVAPDMAEWSWRW